jgi:hypothetical protein
MVCSFKFPVVTLLLLVFLVGAASIFAVALGQSSGYLQYKVTVSSPQNSVLPISAVVNENVQPSGESGFINLTLSLSSSSESFSYSRDVNSSSLPEVFPYLSGLTNQSLTYNVYGISITANLVDTGQVLVTFNGTPYQGTKYLVSFSAVNSSALGSFSGNGNIVSMPSGLIDTIQLTLNQTTQVYATLLSTNLSLNAPATNVNPLGASLLGVALIAAVAIAAPTIFEKARGNKHKDQTPQSENKPAQDGSAKLEEENKKPSYWVD